MARSKPGDDADFERQNEQAIREAREADRIEPRANAVAYDSQKGLILVELRSGFAFGFPPERVPASSPGRRDSFRAFASHPVEMAFTGTIWMWMFP